MVAPRSKYGISPLRRHTPHPPLLLRVRLRRYEYHLLAHLCLWHRGQRDRAIVDEVYISEHASHHQTDWSKVLRNLSSSRLVINQIAACDAMTPSTSPRHRTRRLSSIIRASPNATRDHANCNTTLVEGSGGGAEEPEAKRRMQNRNAQRRSRVF